MGLRLIFDEQFNNLDDWGGALIAFSIESGQLLAEAQGGPPVTIAHQPGGLVEGLTYKISWSMTEMTGLGGGFFYVRSWDTPSIVITEYGVGEFSEEIVAGAASFFEIGIAGSTLVYKLDYVTVYLVTDIPILRRRIENY